MGVADRLRARSHRIAASHHSVPALHGQRHPHRRGAPSRSRRGGGQRARASSLPRGAGDDRPGDPVRLAVLGPDADRPARGTRDVHASPRPPARPRPRAGARASQGPLGPLGGVARGRRLLVEPAHLVGPAQPARQRGARLRRPRPHHLPARTTALRELPARRRGIPLRRGHPPPSRGHSHVPRRRTREPNHHDHHRSSPQDSPLGRLRSPRPRSGFPPPQRRLCPGLRCDRAPTRRRGGSGRDHQCTGRGHDGGPRAHCRGEVQAR